MFRKLEELEQGAGDVAGVKMTAQKWRRGARTPFTPFHQQDLGYSVDIISVERGLF